MSWWVGLDRTHLGYGIAAQQGRWAAQRPIRGLNESLNRDGWGWPTRMIVE